MNIPDGSLLDRSVWRIAAQKSDIPCRLGDSGQCAASFCYSGEPCRGRDCCGNPGKPQDRKKYLVHDFIRNG